MSCAWKDDRCRIGQSLGTGTNAGYLEEIKDIHTIDKEKFQDQVTSGLLGSVRVASPHLSSFQKYMIINTEWGAFGENGELDFVLTKWDRRVDELSVNPGKQVSRRGRSGNRGRPAAVVHACFFT